MDFYLITENMGTEKVIIFSVPNDYVGVSDTIFIGRCVGLDDDAEHIEYGSAMTGKRATI